MPSEDSLAYLLLYLHLSFEVMKLYTYPYYNTLENISIWIYVSSEDNSILVTRICHERKLMKFF